MSARRARLNIFQKTQRLWDTVHPYNAAQAMELDGDFPPLRVANAFNNAIDDLGLGEFVCDGKSYFVGPAGQRVGVTRTRQSFESLVSEQMNRPFEPDVSLPFRPFDLHGVNRPHVVGLTYQHWVADSVSIRLLMRQWLRRLTGDATPAPVRLPSKGLLAAFGPTAAGWSPMAQAASLFTLSSRMRTMRRVDASDDRSVRVMLRAGPDGLVEAVRRRARADGATVGDVFLAAAAEACAAHGPARPTERRPGLCMGSIVDLRARGNRQPEKVFGLFLGFLMTDFSAVQARRFESMLARAVAARRTAAARRSAEASQLNMAVGYGLGKWFGRDKLMEFYRKRFPLAGGLSSVNMTPGWAGEAFPKPLAAYHRVSPTGPMLPVVLTPTTLGDRLRLCCTYRPALTDAMSADTLVATFVDRLARYAG